MLEKSKSHSDVLYIKYNCAVLPFEIKVLFVYYHTHTVESDFNTWSIELPTFSAPVNTVSRPTKPVKGREGLYVTSNAVSYAFTM